MDRSTEGTENPMVWPFVIIFMLAAALFMLRLMRTVGRKPWFKTAIAAYFLLILVVLAIAVAAILFPPKKLARIHSHSKATNPLSIRR